MSFGANLARNTTIQEAAMGPDMADAARDLAYRLFDTLKLG